MSGNLEKLESLILEATEKDDKSLLSEIRVLLTDSSISGESLDACASTLFEAWSGKIESSENRSKFCLSLDGLPLSDSHLLRNAIEASAKRFAPSSLPKSLVAKFIEARNPQVKPDSLFKRAIVLQNLAPERIFFSKQTGLGKISEIDLFTDSVILKDIKNADAGKMRIAEALDSLSIFSEALSLEKFREIAGSHPNEIFSSVSSFLPAKLSPKDLDAICRALLSAAGLDADAIMRISQKSHAHSSSAVSQKNEESEEDISLLKSRNMKELCHFLKKRAELDANDPPTEPELAWARKIFERDHEDSPRAKILYMETLALLLDTHLADETVKTLSDLFQKPFLFPVNPSEFDTETWNSLPLSPAKTLLSAIKLLKTEDYLLELFTRLPLKCMQSCPFEQSFRSAFEAGLIKIETSPDIFLWAWKNRSKFKKMVGNFFSHKQYFKFLTSSSTQTKKEIRNLLISSKEYQKTVLDLCRNEEELRDFIEMMRDSEDFSYDERSSCIVKISRDSQKLKDFLNSEKGRGLQSNRKKSDPGANPSGQSQAPISVSLRSYRLKAKELESIINKELPLNSAAIAHAREYGDLRENAEYSAAKERQNYLYGRRDMLEKELLSGKVLDFCQIVLRDKAIPGSTVEIAIDDGTSEKYHILGAWDSEPNSQIISCESALAQSIVGKCVGVSILLSNGHSATIRAISPLPDEIASNYSKYEN